MKNTILCLQGGIGVDKKTNAILAVGALLLGVSSIPVGAFVSWPVGLLLLALAILLIYLTD